MKTSVLFAIIRILQLYFLIQDTSAKTFHWYEREYSREETDTLLASADQYWSMNNANEDGQGHPNDGGGGLVEGPVKKALKTPSNKEVSNAIPACVANPVLCGANSGFSISMWYSLRPGGGLDYDDNACVLLSVGYQADRKTKIEFNGGAEHNLSFTVPLSSSQDAAIHIENSSMADPQYDVCLRWDSTSQTCIGDNVTQIGWQWNHVALVFNSTTGLKAYYNTFELDNVVEITDTGSLNIVTTPTVLYLNPIGGCDNVGFDEVAIWSRPITQDEVAILRLGPFANENEPSTTIKPSTPKKSTSIPTTINTESTAKRITVNVAREKDNIDLLTQNINQKTASEAQDVLQDTKSILADVASAEIDTEEGAKLADEIVNTGASIAKSVARSPIFLSTDTTRDEKKNVRQQCLETIGVSSNLASQISYQNSTKKTETALQLEDAITSVLNTYLDDPTAPDSETVTSPNLEMRFGKFNTSSGEPIKMDVTNGGEVEIKSDQYIAANSEARLVVAGISDSLKDLLPTSVADTSNSNTDIEVEYNITSTIYNVILGGSNGTDDLDITLALETDLPATDRRIRHCTFLDLTKTPSEWSTEGLTVDLSSTETKTVCKSTHLTNFAILMSVNEIPLTKAQEVSLNVITYVGCSLSLLCLTITIILLFALRDLQRSTRISILKHLAVSMFAAQLLFLAGVETAVWNSKLCTAVAAFLHYLFLAVMCWMLSQGLYLYLKLRRSAKGTWDFVYFCLLGWGFPAVLVAIVAGIKHDAYGTETYCWLSTEDGAMWAFVGPALGIIAVNTAVMILAMNAFTSVKVYKDKSDKEKMRSSLRAVVVMLPILGLTWIFGVFSFNQETIFFQYIFAILNSLQGVFLFIFNILWNGEVKNSLRRKLGAKFGSEESSMFFNRVLGSASVAPSSKGTTETSSFSTGTTKM